mgnify:CR=1 FL=1
MSSFWDRLRGRHDATSADTARDRLKLVLVSDRSDISPEKLAQLQSEIIEVIKRYLEVDDAHVHIKLEQRARENYLVADIPLARDTSYGLLPILDAPPELGADSAAAELEPEPEAEKPPQAAKPRKPRAASSSTRKSSSPRQKRSADVDSEAETEPEPPKG